MSTVEIVSSNNSSTKATLQKVSKDQYTLWQMVGIWLFGGVPMWLLGWVAYPAMSAGLPALGSVTGSRSFRFPGRVLSS